MHSSIFEMLMSESLQISPDGRLLQSSTVSDRIPFTFERGDEHNIPGAYLEFAERRVLPEFSHLEVKLWLRLLPASLLRSLLIL